MKPAVSQEGVENVDEVLTDEAAEAAFEAGYTGTPTEETPPEEPAKPEETAAPSEPEQPAPAASEPAAPSLDAQLQEIVAKVKTVDEMKLAIEKLRGDAFGKLGGLERILKQLQDTTGGQAIEVTAADLAELESEFPGLNLGPSLAKGLTRVLSKVKGPAGKLLTPEEVDARIDARLKQDAEQREAEQKQKAIDRLSNDHADWREVIGPPDSQTEFRTWLKSQGPEKEQAFLSSWDPTHVGGVLKEFKERKPAVTPPAPPAAGQGEAGKKDLRAQRLAEAVPVKGGGLPPAKSRKTEEELAFEEGFSGGR